MSNKLRFLNKVAKAIAMMGVVAFVVGAAATTAPSYVCAATFIPSASLCPNFGLERTITYNLQDPSFAYGYGVATYNGTPKSVYVVGEQYALATGLDAYLIKYDANGAMQWGGPKIYDAGGNESAYGVAVTPNGQNVYMVGRQMDNASLNSNIFVRKYDASTGALVAPFGNTDTNGDGVNDTAVYYNPVAGKTAVGKGVAIDSTGAIYVAGYQQNQAGDMDLLLLKYTPAGTPDPVFGGGTGKVIYNGVSQYGTTRNEEGFSVAVNPANDNEVYVAGYHQPTGSNTDAVTIKYDAAGNPIWIRGYDSSSPSTGTDLTDFANSVTVEPDGGHDVHVVGYQQTNGGDMFIIKYGSGGQGPGATQPPYNSGGSQADAGRSVVGIGNERYFIAGSQQTHNGDAFLNEYLEPSSYALRAPFPEAPSGTYVCVERLTGLVYEKNGTIGRVYVMGTDGSGTKWGSSCGGDPGYWQTSAAKKLLYEFDWKSIPPGSSSFTVTVNNPAFSYTITQDTPSGARYANMATVNDCTGTGLIYVVTDPNMDDAGAYGAAESLQVFCYNNVARWCLDRGPCPWRTSSGWSVVGYPTDHSPSTTCAVTGSFTNIGPTQCPAPTPPSLLPSYLAHACNGPGTGGTGAVTSQITCVSATDLNGNPVGICPGDTTDTYAVSPNPSALGIGGICYSGGPCPYCTIGSVCSSGTTGSYNSDGRWKDANGVIYDDYFCNPITQQRFSFPLITGNIRWNTPIFIYKGDQGGAPEANEIAYGVAQTASSVQMYAGTDSDVYETGYSSENGGQMFLNKYSCNAASKAAFGASFAANVSVTPSLGTAPLTVQADARASAGSIVKYEWDWDYSGVPATFNPSNDRGSLATHTYTSNRNFVVAVRITDTKGNTDIATAPVTVNPNHPPVASFTVTPSSGPAPLVVTVDGSASSDPDALQGGYIQSFTWDWGDKTVAGSGQKTTHTYTAQGTYTITLTVTDNGGLPNAVAATQTVTVTPQYVCTPSCGAPTPVCGPGPTATQCYACLENADCGAGYRCLGTSCKKGDLCPNNTLCPADGKCPEAVTCNPLVTTATCPDGSACPVSGVCPAQKYACVLSSSAVKAQCYVEEFGGCLVDSDCRGSVTGGVCHTATNTCRYARCVNTTGQSCTKNSQCANGGGTCNAGVCNYVYDCGYGPGMGGGASGLYVTTTADPMPAMPLGVQPDGQACTKPTPDAPNNCEGINGCLYYNYNPNGTAIQNSNNSVGTCINTFQGGTGCVYYQYYDGTTQTTKANCLPRYSENTKKTPNAGIPAGCFVMDKGKAGKEYDCSAVNGCYYYLDGRVDCTYNNITATACTTSANCTAEPLAIGVCNAATNLCEYHGNGCLYEPNPKGAIACPGVSKAATGGQNFVQCLLDKDAGLPGFLLGAANKLLSSCKTNADCPNGNICVNGTCYPQCQTNVDCATGQSCTTTCSTSLNCTGGLVCIAGMCVPPTSCTPGTICPNGVICPITGICPPPVSCTPGTICPSGAMCPVSGICPPSTSCIPGTMCPSGLLCPANGVCPPPTSCTPSTICPSGAICPVSGICPPSTMCIPGTVCPSGAICPVSGICPPATSCTPGTICPSGAICPASGVCPPGGPSCTPGTICPSGMVCPVSGICACPSGTAYDAASGTCVNCSTNPNLPGCPAITTFCIANPTSPLCTGPGTTFTSTPGTLSCNTLGYTFTGTAVLPSGNCDLVAIILALLSWLAWIITLLAVLSGLRAAYLYITSMGDERKLILARRYLIYTTIGVGVAVLSFSIVAIARAIFNI